MPSIYQLKPRFQRLLFPLVLRLHHAGITANQVTVSACAVSVALGLALFIVPLPRSWLALIPLWMFVRMAFNAIDGMLAREFHHKSVLGAYLNELTDVVSDAALYLPLALVAPFHMGWIAAIVWLAALSEMAGVIGATVGATRRYDGPMGKSDRAFVFGALSLAAALWNPLPLWFKWILPAVAVLIALTVINRVRRGIAETAP